MNVGYGWVPTFFVIIFIYLKCRKKKVFLKTKGPPIQEDRQMKGKQQKQIPKFAASGGETPKDQQRPSLT